MAAWFTYHGLTKEEVDARMDAYEKRVKPPLIRGEESSKFYPDKMDDPDVVDWKRKNYKDWCKKELAAHRKGVEAEAKLCTFGWAPYRLGGVDRSPPKEECKSITFKAGEAVEVPEDHWIFEKVDQLAKSKGAPWSKSDAKPSKAAMTGTTPDVEADKPKANPKTKVKGK